MSNSMTTQYILSGGAVICKLVDKIGYDHLGRLDLTQPSRYRRCG
jgi:hypothetical protein